MAAVLLDGKALAERVRADVKRRAEAFEARAGRKAGLALVLVGDDGTSHGHVANKAKTCAALGLRGDVRQVAANATQAELMALVAELNRDPGVDGVLVQLPLPAGFDAEPVLLAVDPRKDVDGLHPVNAGLLATGRPGIRPCTPRGCLALLAETGVALAGQRALVIGRSNLVGKPLALMLLAEGCTVTIAHSRTADLAELVRASDLVVSATGVPELVRAAWLKPGAIVLDVGMSWPHGKLVGDLELAAARDVAGFIAPMPGGVGPMTVAMLMLNTVEAAEHSQG